MVETSVIIPTYNREDVISRAIDSALNQTNYNLEVIIIDDGSDDDTQNVVESYGDDRITYLWQKNQGQNAARNTGIKQSEGKYIAFLDSDDEWARSKLEHQINNLKKTDSNTKVSYTGYQKIGQFGEETIIPTKSGWILEDQIIKDWLCPTSTYVMEKSCLEKVGLFNSEVPARTDYIMSLKLAEHFKLDCIESSLMYFYQTQDSRMSDDIPAQIEAHKYIIKLIKELVENNNISLSKKKYSLGMQLYSLGRLYQKNGDHKKARDCFFQSLVNYPSNFKAYVTLMSAFIGYNLEKDEIYQYLSNLK